MSLYQLDAHIQEILENGSINEETGEYVVDETALTEVQIDRVAKVENIVRYIKNLEADADAIKKEVALQNARLKRLENMSKRLKELVTVSMERNGEKKLQIPCADLSLRKSEQCIIDNEIDLPDKYVNVKTSYVPDKAKIKEAIKAGESVTGAHIETKSNLQIK